MDDMGAAYYPPPSGVPHNSHYPYYQPPLQSTLLTSHPLPPAVPHQPSQVIIPHQYFPHQPPPYSIYTPPSYLQSSHDQVRTLFVAGLPEDVKPREIYNLFREFPGYETSHLRPATSSNQPFAFVVFLDQQSAVTALTELNGMVFDLEKESTLHIDLAKSNPRSKRTRIDNENLGSEKRFKGSAVSRSFHDIGVGSLHMSGGMSNPSHNTIGYPSTQSQANFPSRGINEALAAKANPAFHITQKAAPCPTLFVASLGPTCIEHELIDLFSRCAGFLKLKMQDTYGSPVAFVDFQDTACSTEALNQLRGTILYSSLPGEPIRLEYARSRMGMRSKKSN
ncbi:RNA-binding protein, mRNA-processing factor 2a [Impatiens glandulifera]|uniref:RNA-binding protein, mRNA-processing factor 2a n=1 Tax=Impatiens glandulifera TaxID=253017 RepID=UPI001FB07277|nr:RNA-binding protein, mRNA-processing factor 2a [Impatiens glandulifera]